MLQFARGQYCSPSVYHTTQSDQRLLPGNSSTLAEHTRVRVRAKSLQSLHVSENLERWTELKRHARQNIVPRHQQQSLAVNLLQKTRVSNIVLKI